MHYKLYIPVLLLILVCSCRKDTTPTAQLNYMQITDNSSTYDKLYVLNEGIMNENRSTLDVLNFSEQRYYTNIFPYINPTQVKELGDVGNDIQIYGSKLYAVINMSNKIEVMDAHTAKHLQSITLKNCRYICFANGKAYVTSYNRDIASSVNGDGNEANGIVAEIDTTSLNITKTVEVGRQPDGIGFSNNKLYVANSGGYNALHYDNTLSVINVDNFQVVKTIPVAINLGIIKINNNKLYVTSRGDYYQIRSKLFEINTTNDEVVDSLDIAINNFDIFNNKAYIIGTPYSNNDGKINSIRYLVVDLNTHQITDSTFIHNGMEKNITLPYGILLNQANGDIYLSDAKDYQTSGTVYCFTNNGTFKWQSNAGQIPGHFALLKK